MLPKIWKKLLLAICIICVLFNITSKLVNRISLEKTISYSPEGIDMKELLNVVEEEAVINDETTSYYNTVAENNVTTETTAQTQEENVEEAPAEETNNSETEQGPVEEEPVKEDGSIIDITDISDFTTLLY